MLEPLRGRPKQARTNLLGRTILVLTEEFYEGRDIQYVLQHAGAKVIGPMRDTASALRAVAARDLSCAVLDAAFGFEAHCRVASALFDKEVPFITLADGASMVLPDYLSAAPWIAKPADCRELPSLVASMTRFRM